MIKCIFVLSTFSLKRGSVDVNIKVDLKSYKFVLHMFYWSYIVSVGCWSDLLHLIENTSDRKRIYANPNSYPNPKSNTNPNPSNPNPGLEINSEKVKTNRYSVKKVEKFCYRYSTKKVKNNDYTVSI